MVLYELSSKNSSGLRKTVMSERNERTACGDGSCADRERNNSMCGAKMPCSAQLTQKKYGDPFARPIIGT